MWNESRGLGWGAGQAEEGSSAVRAHAGNPGSLAEPLRGRGRRSGCEDVYPDNQIGLPAPAGRLLPMGTGPGSWEGPSRALWLSGAQWPRVQVWCWPKVGPAPLQRAGFQVGPSPLADQLV